MWNKVEVKPPQAEVAHNRAAGSSTERDDTLQPPRSHDTPPHGRAEAQECPTDAGSA